MARTSGANDAKFRPDIQGLRALAVGLVVLDHAKLGPFHGGFIGVDVFFVISGFLITQLLLAEADKHGRVSLLGFYARRARRILPIASMVLAATVIASYLVLNGVDAARVFKQAVAAAFFFVNVQLAHDETNYFAQDDAVSPLQHYWSLSVEEQFYLAWPVIVLLLVWAFRRHGRSRRAVGIAIGAIITVSFAWAVHQIGTNPLSAYFSTAARAWELGLGALTAAVLMRVRTLPPWLLAAASWVGVAMIGLASLTFTQSTLVPGAPALLPVVGAALLLGGGAGAAPWGPQWLFSLLPMRWVGDRSYSMYLWHWPALILVSAGWHPLTTWEALAVCAVALGLSDLSYRYVENPFRTAVVLKPRLRGIALYPVSVAALGVVILGAHLGLNHRYATPHPAITVSSVKLEAGDPTRAFSSDPAVALVEASVLAAERHQAIPNPLKPSALGLTGHVAADLGDCEYWGKPYPLPVCPRGDTHGTKTLVLLGDSHARHWIPAMDKIARANGYVAYYFVLQGCTPALVEPWAPEYDAPNTDCLKFHDWTQQQITRLKPDAVILASDVLRRYIGANGEVVSDKSEIASMIHSGMVERLNSLKPLAKRVIVLGDISRVNLDPTRISDRGATLADGLGRSLPLSLLGRRVTKEAAQATGVDYVETIQWFCAFGKCPLVVGDYITRRDPGHMTLEYSSALAGPLGRALELS